ncbi:hypothetical protein BHM03_00021186 [Ensete ventricosum]|nr:hypothetical protein BHM03_00021186 [Ensete ventricosum]
MLASLSACAQKVGMHEWGYGGPFGASNLPKNPEETAFFKSDGSWNTPYGRFFLEWYSGLLLLHGERLCMVADEIFLGTGVRISAKVAGIHWHYGTLSHPSELTAGYYNTIFRDGYLPIAEMFSRYRVALCCMLLRSSSRPGTTASLLPPIPPQFQSKKKASPFPALSRPDDPDRARELRLEMEKDADRKSEAEGRIHDRGRDRDQDGDRDRDERRRSDRERDRDR